MPNVTIKGIVPGVRATGELKQSVAEALAGMEELGIEPRQVRVWTPADIEPYTASPALRASIVDLFDEPEGKAPRTKETCDTVSDVLKVVIARWAREHMPRCHDLEARVSLHGMREDGYATCDPHDLADESAGD